jgi:SAM-dependent methyltransferase
VLEVGCGTGNHIIGIEEVVGCSCRGIDPSAEMLVHAVNRGSQVQFSSGKAESLEFPAESFDLVFTVDVIHHVGDRQAFFNGANRILRPGGRICTATDSDSMIRERQPLSAYFPETADVDLQRYPRVAELKSEMCDAGFADVVEQNVEFACELTDIGPYRSKAFSCLRLISADAFQRGLARMEQDLKAGPIQCVSRYCLIWGRKSC